jgi:hypothetical protein
MVVFLLASPVLTNIFYDPTDVTFAAVSGLAFWMTLSFYNSKKMKHLWLASVFVALAVLTRKDGMFLFIILLGLSFLVGFSTHRFKSAVLACVIPFVVFVAGFNALYYLVTGNYTMTAQRVYEAFEQGHGVAYRNKYAKTSDVWPRISSQYYTRNPHIEGQLEARRLFGTPEENNYSMITAIRKNPEAYLQRVKENIKQIPRSAFFIYGQGLGLIFFLLSVRGLIGLILRKSYIIALLMLLWLSYLTTYIFISLRPHYFLQPYYVVFALASIGLTAIFSNYKSKKEFILWTIVLVLFAISGVILQSLQMLVASCIFLIGLWITWTIVGYYKDHQEKKLIGLITALSIILIIGIGYRGGYPSPKFRKLGTTPEEKAVLFMREHLEPGARVGAYYPWSIWTANMTYERMYLSLRSMNTEKDVLDWMKDKHLKAIYVDEELRNFEPSVWKLIENQIGRNFKIVFNSDDESVQVLMVKRKY